MKITDKKVSEINEDLATDDDQIERRREIAAQTDANNRLEGFPPPKKDSFAWRLREQWINGEITSDERLAALKKHYSHCLKQ